MSAPLVSVVLPVFNGERFLAEAIESVLGQTRSPVELIVVDDGSTDGSAEIARSYPVSYLHQENGGVAAARNTGVAAANGELLAFIDQDDTWLPQKLELQAEALARDTAAGICICRYEMALEPGLELPEWIEDPTMFERGHLGFIVGALLVRRERFDEVGEFDTTYQAANDTDWFLRMRELGVGIAVVDEPLMRYRIHDSNASWDRDVIEREHMQAFHASVVRRRAQREATHD